MLGRFASPGCCPGTRAGRPPGPDCSGGERDTRKAKRRERREVEREIRASITLSSGKVI